MTEVPLLAAHQRVNSVVLTYNSTIREFHGNIDDFAFEDALIAFLTFVKTGSLSLSCGVIFGLFTAFVGAAYNPNLLRLPHPRFYEETSSVLNQYMKFLFCFYSLTRAIHLRSGSASLG